MMKKLIVLFILFELAFVANAQISTSIWGLNLGLSTMADVEKVVKSHGFSTYSMNSNEASMMVPPSWSFNFGGQAWTSAHFVFVDGKLAEISFQTLNEYINLIREFNALNQKLESKYSKYKCDAKTPEISGNTNNYTHYNCFGEYSDGKTVITIKEFSHNNSTQGIAFNSLSLTYADKSLMSKRRVRTGVEDL